MSFFTQTEKQFDVHLVHFSHINKASERLLNQNKRIPVLLRIQQQSDNLLVINSLGRLGHRLGQILVGLQIREDVSPRVQEAPGSLVLLVVTTLVRVVSVT